MILRIGTRGSRLALAQSHLIKAEIEGRHADLDVRLVPIRTRGDRILDSPLSRIGGKGLFVKEIEDALLRKDIDLAVHSMKDMPVDLPEGLHAPIFPRREDPRDAFISLNYRCLEELPQGALVGTGSLRRSSQLLRLRPDLNIGPVRGNVDTRLGKLGSGGFHGIILAAAGLNRLGLSGKVTQILEPPGFLPAVGQGALGIEIRQDDDMVYDLLRFLNHEPTELTVRAERAFLRVLEGGCQVPVAALGQLDGKSLSLCGLVADLEGTKVLRHEAVGVKDHPESVGISLAQRLLESGADVILKSIRGEGGNE